MIFEIFQEKIMKTFKLVAVNFILILSFNAAAVEWPGSSTNCTISDSLGTCINAQPDGGSVTVVKEGLALSFGTITLNKGFTLRVGHGYHTILRNVSVNINVPEDKTVRFEGFDFEEASIINATVTTNSELNILSNSWSLPSTAVGEDEGIRVTSIASSGNEARVNISGNNLIGDNNDSFYGLLDISHNGTGKLNANIHDNHITVLDSNPTSAEAVYILNVGTGIFDCQFIANEIRGAQSQFKLSQSNLAASLNLGMVSNLFTGVIDASNSIAINSSNSAIISKVSAGSFVGVIGNNTIDGVKRTGTSDGIGFDFSVHTTVGSSSVDILNNIIVNTKDAYVGPASGTSMSVDSLGNNLIFGHENISGFVLDTTDYNAPPNFIEVGVNYALSSLSPAIDKANSFATALLYNIGIMEDSPNIDADGLRRFKGVKIDSGAYEWGDRHVLHRAFNPTGQISDINDSQLNSDPNAITVTTQVWNYENAPVVYNDHPIGIYRNGSKWSIFNEDLANIPTDAKFHVFYPYGGVSDDINGLAKFSNPETPDSGFDINDVNLNNNSNAGIFASNYWDNLAGGIYNPSSLEVGYQNDGTWYLGNVDGSDMPTNAQVFIYSQDGSRNVFHHEVTDNNTTNQITLIDHPLLNGNPCALPTVTQSTTWFFAPLFEQNPHNIGVYYSYLDNKWAIFNQDIADITVVIGSPIIGGRFNVMVDPQQVYQCNDVIFKNNFE